jgi:hypothetical protein
MSAIASFTKLPKSALAGVREAAVPKKRFFGGLRDTYEEYLQRHGREVAEYRWSGFVLATLLPYLQEKHQIDLMKSDYNELGTFLTSARGATHFILTASQNAAFSQQLDPRLFSEEEMERYFNEFNETNEQGIGRAMLDGIAAFRESLTSLDDQSVIVFRIA